MSNQIANTAVARLTEAGVLTETTGRDYRREFQAAAVMEILFGQIPRN